MADFEHSERSGRILATFMIVKVSQVRTVGLERYRFARLTEKSTMVAESRKLRLRRLTLFTVTIVLLECSSRRLREALGLRIPIPSLR